MLKKTQRWIHLTDYKKELWVGDATSFDNLTRLETIQLVVNILFTFVSNRANNKAFLVYKIKTRVGLDPFYKMISLPLMVDLQRYRQKSQ